MANYTNNLSIAATTLVVKIVSVGVAIVLLLIYLNVLLYGMEGVLWITMLWFENDSVVYPKSFPS